MPLIVAAIAALALVLEPGSALQPAAASANAHPQRRLVELVRPAGGDPLVLERANRITAELAAEGIEVWVRYCQNDEPCAPVPELGAVARIVVEADPTEGVRLEASTLTTPRIFGSASPEAATDAAEPPLARSSEEPDEPGALAIRVVEAVRGVLLETAALVQAPRPRGVPQIADDELPVAPLVEAAVEARPLWTHLRGGVALGLLVHSGLLPSAWGPLLELRWREPGGWGARVAGLWPISQPSLTQALRVRSQGYLTLEAERASGSLAAGAGVGLYHLSVGSLENAAVGSVLWSACLSARLTVAFPVTARVRGLAGLSLFVLALPATIESDASWVASTGRWGGLLWLGWQIG